MEVLNAHNNDFEAPKPEHELIQAYFRKPKNDENGEFRTASEVIQVIGMGGLGYKLTANAVGRALLELGYKCKRYTNARGYYVVQLSTEEVIARRKRLAIEPIEWQKWQKKIDYTYNRMFFRYRWSLYLYLFFVII